MKKIVRLWNTADAYHQLSNPNLAASNDPNASTSHSYTMSELDLEEDLPTIEDDLGAMSPTPIVETLSDKPDNTDILPNSSSSSRSSSVPNRISSDSSDKHEWVTWEFHATFSPIWMCPVMYFNVWNASGTALPITNRLTHENLADPKNGPPAISQQVGIDGYVVLCSVYIDSVKKKN
jgi:hypothetical protein